MLADPRLIIILLHFHGHRGNWIHIPPSVGKFGLERGRRCAASILITTPSDYRPALHEVRRGHKETLDDITDPRAAAGVKHLDEDSFSFVVSGHEGEVESLI